MKYFNTPSRAIGAALATVMMLSGTAASAATATDTFDVLLTIEKTCSVTAGAGSNIDLGTVASTATNVEGSNSIAVTCTKGTPYFIGLAPTSGNTDGSGLLASTTAGNADEVPYQLQQTAGAGGTVWGNTATDTSVGNGVTGTGSGAAQSHTVYANAPSANFTADDYRDTVTVNVNY
ncbi:Csu type fimbrial protein [Parasphingorhabdus sp.]|uniref:Csu type fimbrial protein n=1 Tax=Parasphingorhabdus sp. TaxID=2709688 RepID=UPI002F95F7C7